MKKALIVIDVQESFRQQPIWEAASNPDIVDRTNRLVSACRAQGHLVVWILDGEPGSGGLFDPDRGFVRLMAGLEPLPGEPIITKTSHNAFTTTNLQQLLTQRGITDLLISGIRTEQCCETTTRVGADLGYKMTYVVDATATTPIEHRDAPPGRSVAEILADPLTLTTEEIVRRTEYALAGRFATICTINEVAAQPASIN
ncbi:cysteine hydrolase family protein [Arthrobacter sp. KNU-44]|uniref:cysteine hydrolase family protein n=1 Tax=Arthrobacter sp. KNU-44 TaxID=3450744 RepID=UPI003F43E50B